MQEFIRSAYVAVKDGPFLEALWFIIVVDAKLLKQDLILIRRDGTRQSLLGLLDTHTTFLNKSPERGVVKVVDVA
jgi:hypothetical protein